MEFKPIMDQHTTNLVTELRQIWKSRFLAREHTPLGELCILYCPPYGIWYGINDTHFDAAAISAITGLTESEVRFYQDELDSSVM